MAAIHNGIQVLSAGGPETLNDDQGEAARQALALLERQSRHMTRLVNDLLDITRINNGKIVLQRRPLALNDCVDAVVAAHRPRLDARQLRLTVELPQPPLVVDADPDRLDQVLGNLLSNAVKYTEPDGSVTLAAERQGDVAVIKVRDSGVGIAPEALATLFDPFSQIEDSRHHSEHGLGLGLALVKSLVELHGGTVEAHSEGLGKGCEFRVRLPLASAPAASAESTAPGPTAPSHSRPRLRPRRILVVDDNRDIADPFAALLRALGHQVEVAYGGEIGLRIAQKLRPEVAFLDLGMPGMDGFELARRLREDFPPEALTLVAVTGYGQDEARAQAREAGFDHHLLKPTDLATVTALLDELG